MDKESRMPLIHLCSRAKLAICGAEWDWYESSAKGVEVNGNAISVWTAICSRGVGEIPEYSTGTGTTYLIMDTTA